MSLVEFERSASKCGENGFYRGDLFGNRLLRVGIKEDRGWPDMMGKKGGGVRGRE